MIFFCKPVFTVPLSVIFMHVSTGSFFYYCYHFSVIQVCSTVCGCMKGAVNIAGDIKMATLLSYCWCCVVLGRHQLVIEWHATRDYQTALRIYSNHGEVQIVQPLWFFSTRPYAASWGRRGNKDFEGQESLCFTWAVCQDTFSFQGLNIYILFQVWLSIFSWKQIVYGGLMKQLEKLQPWLFLNTGICLVSIPTVLV